MTILYGAMVDALLTGIQAYCNTLSAKQVNIKYTYFLIKFLSGTKCCLSGVFYANELLFTLFLILIFSIIPNFYKV